MPDQQLDSLLVTLNRLHINLFGFTWSVGNNLPDLSISSNSLNALCSAFSGLTSS